MESREIIFSANDDQLDQLRYALVDRLHELERALSERDCDEGYLQSALDQTKQLALALKAVVG